MSQAEPQAEQTSVFFKVILHSVQDHTGFSYYTDVYRITAESAITLDKNGRKTLENQEEDNRACTP